MKKFIKLLLTGLLTISNSYAGIDVKTYIPKKAYTYAPLLKQQQLELWKDHPNPTYLTALAEQESCISLTHSKCWDPKSRLKSSREEGAGIPQITRAYSSNGSVRFDSLSDMRKAHMTELKELSWSNVYVRPDLQLKILVLMNRDNFKRLYEINSLEDRLAFTDAAYNGGLGGVMKDRRLCGMKANCDPKIWFGNVERTCAKSRKILYANHDACWINRDHVEKIVKVRSAKYKTFFN